MWQRKQTIFLLLAALLAFSTWLFPIATFERADGVHALRTTGLFDASGEEDALRTPMLPFSVLHTVLGAALLVSIVLFRNRPRQAQIVRGTYLLTLAMIAFQYITRNSTLAYLAQAGAVEAGYGLAFFAPIIGLVLAFMAERAIRSDEALVRSTERLR